MAKASVIETNRIRYEEDLYAWTQEQAALLRARQHDALDWENLAEEIAALGGSDRRKLESRVCVILLHLLKWQAQPGLRGASAPNGEIRKLLEQSPSLRRQISALIREAYPDAVKDAVDETGRPGIFRASVPIRRSRYWTRTICPTRVSEA